MYQTNGIFYTDQPGAPPFVFFEGWDSTVVSGVGFQLESRSLPPAPLNRPVRWRIFDLPEITRSVKLKACQPRCIFIERNVKNYATLFTPAI